MRGPAGAAGDDDTDYRPPQSPLPETPTGNGPNDSGPPQGDPQGEPDTTVHPHAQHRFDNAPRWAKRFEDPKRDVWQRPDAVLDAMALTPSSLVADIGSATGYFPVRIAEKVTAGRVWGVDVAPEMVRYLNLRARKQGIGNLYSILGTPDDALLPEPVDRVLIVNTYHHIEKRVAYFKRLRKSLRPGAQVIIIDFKMGELPVGPPDASKVPAAQITREFTRAGYRLLEQDDALLPHQVFLVYTPARP